MKGEGVGGEEAAGKRRLPHLPRLAFASILLLGVAGMVLWSLRDPDPRIVRCKLVMSGGVQGTHVILNWSGFEHVPAGRPTILPGWFPWPAPTLPERRFLFVLGDRTGPVGFPRALGVIHGAGGLTNIDRGPDPAPFLTRKKAQDRMDELFRGEEGRARVAERRHGVVEGR